MTQMKAPKAVTREYLIGNPGQCVGTEVYLAALCICNRDLKCFVIHRMFPPQIHHVTLDNSLVTSDSTPFLITQHTVSDRTHPI